VEAKKGLNDKKKSLLKQLGGKKKVMLASLILDKEGLKSVAFEYLWKKWSTCDQTNLDV
jgi:hypothetical protein